MSSNCRDYSDGVHRFYSGACSCGDTKRPRNSSYPHRCPLCMCDAYVGAYAVKCSNAWCKHFEPPKFEFPSMAAYEYPVADASDSLKEALLNAAAKAHRLGGIAAWLPDPSDPDDNDSGDPP